MQHNSASRKKTLIVGLGKTGLSCARYLAKAGVPVAITDSRELPPGLQELRQELPDMALFLGGFDASIFSAAEQLVVSPGVPLSTPVIQQAIASGVPVIGDIELFAQAVNAPVAAITGSNGKSTVTTLLGLMARAAGRNVAVGGNLGEPALDLLDDTVDLYLLELSSFQLETTYSLQLQSAVVLNLSADHQDRYPDLEAYAETKSSIYRQARNGVYNLDDSLVMAMQQGHPGDLYFTLGEPEADQFGLCQTATETWLCRGVVRLLNAAELKVPGRHNLANALAALAMGEQLGLPMEAMLTALRGFAGLAHRTQFIAEHAGVRWYNDSKGTNIGACVAALEGLHDATSSARSVLIAGGVGKGADFSALAPVVSQTCRAVVLLGEDAGVMGQALADTVPLLYAEDMVQAVALAAGQARAGDQVVLSPACASLDMFQNYQHRGEVFTQAVREWIA